MLRADGRHTVVHWGVIGANDRSGCHARSSAASRTSGGGASGCSVADRAGWVDRQGFDRRRWLRRLCVGLRWPRASSGHCAARQPDSRVVRVSDLMHGGRNRGHNLHNIADARGALERHELDRPGNAPPSERRDDRFAVWGVVPVHEGLLRRGEPDHQQRPPSCAGGALERDKVDPTADLQPTRRDHPSLTGVSCTSVSACTAVGNNFFSNTGSPEFVERWNGTTWALQTLPAPGDAAGWRPFALSCNSPTACTVVGLASNGTGGNNPIAERWNGRTWSIQTLPVPPGGAPWESAYLTGVSCTSNSACTAFGGIDLGGDVVGPYAWSWNGTSWTLQTVPSQPLGNGWWPEEVSCTSAAACTAVGYYQRYTDGALVNFADRWNGTSWSDQPMPDPSTGAGDALLNGVSCSSSTACTAVGNYDGSTTTLTLAERWNGTSWAVQPTP